MMRRTDLSAGAIVTATGLFLAYEASGYPLGTMHRIGPGAFPMLLGLVLAGLGAALLVVGLGAGKGANGEDGPGVPIAFRAPFAILAAIGVFAVTIRSFGLVPAAAAVVVISAFAQRKPHLPTVFVLALLLGPLCSAIFIFGLGLPLQPFKW
jgi:hypothetical protein